MVKIQTRIVIKKCRDKVYSYKQHTILLPFAVKKPLEKK